MCHLSVEHLSRLPWRTPSLNSTPSPSLSTPIIGSAVLRWPEKIQLPTRMNALTIRERAMQTTTLLKMLTRIKMIMAERATLATQVTPVTLTLAVAILTRKSPTLTSPPNSEKTASSLSKSNSTALSRTSASSVGRLDISQKNVWRHLPLPLKPAPLPLWKRTPMPGLAWSQKICEQSSDLHANWGLCWTVHQWSHDYTHPLFMTLIPSWLSSL